MLVAVLDFAGQRRYVIMKACRGERPAGGRRAARRGSACRAAAASAPGCRCLAGQRGAEPGLLRWSSRRPASGGIADGTQVRASLRHGGVDIGQAEADDVVVWAPFAVGVIAEHPVRVNLIAAGFVDTPLSASLLGDRIDERSEQLRTTLPIGRVVGPSDIAAMAVHLMTNTAITGATFDINGGQQLVEE